MSYKSETLSFKTEIKDADGVIVPVASISEVEVWISQEVGGEVLEKYSLTEREGFQRLTILGDAIWCYISSEVTKRAISGDLLVQITFKVPDTNFPEGVRTMIQKAVLTSVQEAKYE